MLIRLSLIVAVIAGLAVGALNFITVKEKITTLKANLESETQQKSKALQDLASTKRDLDKTSTDLKQTQETLASTTAEKDKAVAIAATATAKATQLSEELDNTKKTLGDAQAEVAQYRASGLNPAQVLALSKTLKQSQDTIAALQEENKLVGQKVVKLETRLKIYEQEDYKVELPANLKGKILVSDPKWEFVVINVGEDQGVLQDGELLVNRNGKLVAKVKVTTVQKDRCIANVMPGWKLGELIEGDQVIPAHPSSS